MSNHEVCHNNNRSHISEVPESWKLKRLKYLTKPKKEFSETGKEELLSVTETRGIIQRSDLKSADEPLSRSDDLIGYRLVEQGNLVNNIMLVWKRGLGVSPYSGIVSPAYSVFSFSKECDPWYFNYLLRSEEYVTEFRRNSTGITMSRLRLYDDSFGDVFGILPPLTEQKLISRYLDKKTTQIDSLINKIEKKIELLKQQRASLINQLVTKGLDPNVEMKDSGIKWIGEIPKHWTIKKFGYVSRLETGNTPSKENEELFFTEDENGFPWVKPSDLDVGFEGVNTSEVRLTEQGKSQSRVVPKDSVLVCCIGNTSGKFSIANTELSTNQQINSITFNCEIFPRFGFYFMDVFGRDLLKWMNYVTLPIISKGDLSKESIVVPSIREQKLIASLLDEMIHKILKSEKLHLKKIEFLREYRQSIISSVTTGKLKVTEDMV